jgi:hypothetical protein
MIKLTKRISKLICFSSQSITSGELMEIYNETFNLCVPHKTYFKIPNETSYFCSTREADVYDYYVALIKSLKMYSIRPAVLLWKFPDFTTEELMLCFKLPLIHDIQLKICNTLISGIDIQRALNILPKVSRYLDRYWFPTHPGKPTIQQLIDNE